MSGKGKGKIICLTGGVGCGKSRISEIISKEFGFKVLDSDKFTKIYVMNPGQEGYEKIVKYFGNDVLLADGNLNRKKLAQIVFSDEKKLKKLNSFTHPATIKALKKECRELFAKGEKLVFIESAIPFAADYQDFCDEFWYVYAKRSDRIGRLIKNRGYSHEECMEIMKMQPSDKTYREHASLIINNDDDADYEKQKKKIGRTIKEWFAS